MSGTDQVQMLVEALTSDISDSQILQMLEKTKSTVGRDFPSILNQVYVQLPFTHRDHLTCLLALHATHVPDTSVLLGRIQEKIKPEEAQIILVNPNPAIDVYLSDGAIYPGGAGGTVGSILSSCEMRTIVCGFLSHNPSGEVFRTLMRKRGVETGYFTEINQDCGFTIYLSATEKLSRIGPRISAKQVETFSNQFRAIIDSVNPDNPPLLILSGSIPESENGRSERLYYDLIQSVRKTGKELKIWVDAKSKFLFWALQARPDYVKISQEEFLETLDLLKTEGQRAYGREEVEEGDEEALAAVAKLLIDQMRIPAMTVTLGQSGAFQVRQDTQTAVLVKPIRPRKRIYTAGLGDTMLAIQAIGEVTGSVKLRSLEYAVAAALVSGDKPGTELLVSLSEIEPYTRYLIRRTFGVPADLLPRFTLRSIVQRMKRTGIEPIVVADMDDTLTPFRREISDEMVEGVIQLLEKGIKFVILTSSSYEAVQSQVLNKLFSRIPDKSRLAGCYIFVTQGSQAYYFNKQRGRFELSFILDLQDPEILGSDRVERIKEIILQAAKRFRLKSVRGEFIEDRRSQITFMVLGTEATPQEKDVYDKRGGKEKRAKIAQYLNRLLAREEIGVYGRAAGKSSIDITPLGIDKGFGMEKICEVLGVGTYQLIFIAEELWEDGVDLPGAQKAAVTVNTGPAVRGPSAPPILHSRKFGPEGTLETLRTIIRVI